MQKNKYVAEYCRLRQCWCVWIGVKLVERDLETKEEAELMIELLQEQDKCESLIK